MRQSWIDGGDLTTPLFEYKEFSGNYGNPKEQSGPYIEMFTKYLSKTPLIQEYLQYATFKKALDFPELFKILDTIPGLQGTERGEFYETSDLKHLINRVREGKLALGVITRTAGLRGIVWDLLRKEQKKR